MLENTHGTQGIAKYRRFGKQRRSTIYTPSLFLSGEAGSIIDSSVNSTPVTLTGVPTLTSAQQYGGSWSIQFNGTAKLINVAKTAILIADKDFSCDFWVRLSSITNQYIFTLLGSGWFNSYIIRVTNATTIAWGEVQTAIDVTVSTMAINTWYHIEWCRENGNNYLFFNGVLISTQYNTQNLQSYSATSIQVGGWADGPNYLNGYLDNFRFVLNKAIHTRTWFTGAGIFVSYYAFSVYNNGNCLITGKKYALQYNANVPTLTKTIKTFNTYYSENKRAQYNTSGQVTNIGSWVSSFQRPKARSSITYASAEPGNLLISFHNGLAIDLKKPSRTISLTSNAFVGYPHVVGSKYANTSLVVRADTIDNGCYITDLADLSDIGGTNSTYCIEFWLYCGYIMPKIQIGGLQNGVTLQPMLWTTNNSTANLTFQVQANTTAFVVTNASMPRDSWVHFAFQRNSTNSYTLYVNGIAFNTITVSNYPNLVLSDIKLGWVNGSITYSGDMYMNYFMITRGIKYSANFNPITDTGLSSLYYYPENNVGYCV